MKKAKRFIGILMLVACLVYILTLFQDRASLGREIIRFHVVAASDSAEDQSVKLQVRDAVLAFLEKDMGIPQDVQQAREYLQTHLPQIQAVANETLQALGEEAKAMVTLLQEAFPTRDYEAFRLPAGVYETLKITIGPGEGKNWWCVVFPRLCLPAASVTAEDVAAGAGFSGPLTDTITGQEGYRVRFFFLEVLGKLESFLWGG